MLPKPMAAFPFVCLFYQTDFGRTAFIRVTNSDQIFFHVGVSFCADFCNDKKILQTKSACRSDFVIFFRDENYNI